MTMWPSHRSGGSGIELLIRKLEQCAPLSEEARHALKMLPTRMQDFARGQVIVDQGFSNDECALLVSGFTVRYKVLKDGLRQIVSMQVPGDFADLQCFVLNPIDHAIAAAAPSRIARIPHAALAQMLKQHPELWRWLMWDMALEAAIGQEWMAALGRLNAYQQIAHLFCELYFRLTWAGRVQAQGFEFALNQAELGDACGLSTVHVNRSLQSLRKDGLIALENHHLVIPDIDALMAAAAFDPAYLHGLGQYQGEVQLSG
jgi:CRP-like cAMP-binding protein